MFESRPEDRRECRHVVSVCDVIDIDCLETQPAASVYIFQQVVRA